MQTDFLTKCKVLGAIWIEQSENSDFNEFMRFNDLGLPLAYAHTEGMATIEDKGKIYIEQSWERLLDHPAFDWNEIDDTIDEEE